MIHFTLYIVIRKFYQGILPSERATENSSTYMTINFRADSCNKKFNTSKYAM